MKLLLIINFIIIDDTIDGYEIINISKKKKKIRAQNKYKKVRLRLLYRAIE